MDNLSDIVGKMRWIDEWDRRNECRVDAAVTVDRRQAVPRSSGSDKKRSVATPSDDLLVASMTSVGDLRRCHGSILSNLTCDFMLFTTLLSFTDANMTRDMNEYWVHGVTIYCLPFVCTNVPYSNYTNGEHAYVIPASSCSPFWRELKQLRPYL